MKNVQSITHIADATIMLIAVKIFNENKTNILPQTYVIDATCYRLGKIRKDPYDLRLEYTKNFFKSNSAFTLIKGPNGGLQFHQ